MKKSFLLGAIAGMGLLFSCASDPYKGLDPKLAADLQTENQKNSLQLRDSINSFLKIYNKTKGYSLIISNTGFDNLLYADTAYNITQEIVEGLNARYNPSSAKK